MQSVSALGRLNMSSLIGRRRAIGGCSILRGSAKCIRRPHVKATRKKVKVNPFCTSQPCNCGLGYAASVNVDKAVPSLVHLAYPYYQSYNPKKVKNAMVTSLPSLNFIITQGGAGMHPGCKFVRPLKLAAMFFLRSSAKSQNRQYSTYQWVLRSNELTQEK